VRKLATTLVLTAGVLCTACKADTATLPATVADPYGSLRLDTRSIVMSLAAPYDTLQLHAGAYSMGGTPITTLGTPTYMVSDTSIVVSATGLVTAKTRTSNSYVVVTLRDSMQNVTHADTAFITVTNETAPPALASLSLHLATGDSAKLAINDGTLITTKSLVITATGTGGEDLSSLVHVRYRSSDTSVATVISDQPIVKGFQIGKTVITAATTWYGVTKSSSLTMQIGNPVFFKWAAGLTPSATAPGEYAVVYAPTDFTIGVGGIVEFWPPLDRAHQGMTMDVIFDDPTAAQPVPFPDSVLGMPTGAGNVHLQTPRLAPGDTSVSDWFYACFPSFKTFTPPFINVCVTTRSFPRAGKFAWHSDLWNVHGTITITEL
jgi:hypothetical protein